MVSYQCSRCLKTFKQKNDFDRHCNRKFKCKEVEKKDMDQSTFQNFQNAFQNQVKNLQTEQNGSTFSPFFHQMEHFGTPNQSKIDQFKMKNLEKNQFSDQKIQDFLKKDNFENFEKFECFYCKKTYSTKFNLNKHMKKCKIKKMNPDIEPPQQKTQTFFIDNSNTQTINNTINNNNQTIININAFGNEDLNFLTDAKIKYLMAQVLPKDIIPKMIKDIHCNPEQPQNMNIYKPNKRDNMLMKFDGEKWLMELSKKSINCMIDSNFNMLDSRLAKMGLTEAEIRKIQNIHQNVNNEEQRKEMMEQVVCDLYNNRDRIERAKLQEAIDEGSDDLEAIEN